MSAAFKILKVFVILVALFMALPFAAGWGTWLGLGHLGVAPTVAAVISTLGGVFALGVIAAITAVMINEEEEEEAS